MPSTLLRPRRDLPPHTGGKEVPTSGLTFPSAPGSSRLVDLKPKQAPGLPYRPGQNTDDGASSKSFSSAGLLRGPGICIPNKGLMLLPTGHGPRGFDSNHPPRHPRLRPTAARFLLMLQAPGGLAGDSLREHARWRHSHSRNTARGGAYGPSRTAAYGLIETSRHFTVFLEKAYKTISQPGFWARSGLKGRQAPFPHVRLFRKEGGSALPSLPPFPASLQPLPSPFPAPPWAARGSQRPGALAATMLASLHLHTAVIDQLH